MLNRRIACRTPSPQFSSPSRPSSRTARHEPGGRRRRRSSAPQSPAPQGSAGRGGWQGAMDEARARQLYVSNDHADHGRGVNFERQIEAESAKKTSATPRYRRVSSISRRSRIAAASATSTSPPTSFSR